MSLCKTHIQRPVVYSLPVSVYMAAVCVNGRLSSPCHTLVYCCGKIYELVEMQQCSFTLSYLFKTELLMRRLRRRPHLIILPVKHKVRRPSGLQCACLYLLGCRNCLHATTLTPKNMNENRIGLSAHHLITVWRLHLIHFIDFCKCMLIKINWLEVNKIVIIIRVVC